MRIDKIKVPEGIGLHGLAVKGSDEEYYDTSTIVVKYEELDYIEPQKVANIPDNVVNDGTPIRAECGMGVEIEGFLFIPEEIQGDESYRKREFQRTKIMSGGQFVSRTAYVPREYSFTCYFDVEPEEPYAYDEIFTKMQNKKCKVISPYISSNPFYSEVKIQKTNPQNAPGTIKVDVKLKEIPDAKLRIQGDAEFNYPSTNDLSSAAIKVLEDVRNASEDDEGQQVTSSDLKFNDDMTSGTVK